MTQGARRLAKIFERPNREQIARRLGIGTSYLSLLEAGKRTPSMKVAAKMEKELGIPVSAWTR